MKQPYQNTIVPLMNMARNPNGIRRVVISQKSTATTTAGGVLQGSIALNPSGYDDWSTFASIYDQFRVVGGQVKISCAVANSVVIGGLVRWAFDNDSAGTPSSYTDVTGYAEITDIPAVFTGTVKSFNFRRPTIRGMPQSQNVWYDEGTPSASPGAVKYYGDGLTGSTLYYVLITDFLVEWQYRS
jgi:hypothetical protein